MRLRELFEDVATKVVAVMPGGFHPFHPGHKSLYDWAVSTFGVQNVYVAATNDTTSRPFPFDIKQKLATMAGVPAQKFIQVKSPFNALSYENILGDTSKTALVFVRSEKYKTSHPLPDQIRKSDGNVGYIISYVTDDNLVTADRHAHMAYGPTIDFDFKGMAIRSATELRNAWPQMAPEEKMQAAGLMYPGNAEMASKLLDDALGTEPAEEPIKEEVKDTLPNKIKVMKPQNPPKAPDATIPISRNGYTADDGTTYIQDKYDDNLVHVSDGGGTYTFDGSRMVKWKTPMIGGLQYTYDYVQRNIKMNFKTDVDPGMPGSNDPIKVGTGKGDVNTDQSAMYDFKGNKIADSSTVKAGAGSFSVSQDKSGITTRDAMFDPFNDVTIVLKSNPAKVEKYGKEKLQKAIDKYAAYSQQSALGRAMPNVDHEKQLRQILAVADATFLKNGRSIPASQAISGAKEWWASLNKTNKDKNARIAKMRAPQTPTQAVEK